MGMSASQARFLGLTARKTNVEYEGQQINQQRTTLSNQSANYYNNLLGMEVPVPPSVADYTKTVYSFQDGYLTNSITSMIAKNNGEYTVSYISSWTDDFSIVSSKSSLINKAPVITDDSDLFLEFTEGTAGGCYTYALEHDGNQIEHLIHTLAHLVPVGTHTTSDGHTVTVNSGDQYWGDKAAPPYGGSAPIMAKIRDKIADKDISQKFIDLLYKCKTSPSTAAASDALKAELKSLIDNDLRYSLATGFMVGSSELRVLGKKNNCEFDTNGNIIGYNGNDEYLKTLSSEQLTQLYAEEKEYIAMLNEKFGTDDDTEWLVRYVQNTSTGTWSPYFYRKSDVENAIYDKNDTQRSDIQCYTIGSSKKTEEVKGVNARIEQDSSGRLINITFNPGQDDQVTYALSTETVTDQAAYDDASNQYEFDKYQYDQTIQEINAKIEIIQSQDKNLELRLKQLDTEQDAITTEMDAVQKVIEKNTESTFKTFG